MLEVKLHTLLVVAHLVGLALGAGGAFVTDIFVARYAILSRIDAKTPDIVEFLGNIVAVGLAILWLTGLALMAEAMILKPLFYTNQKFWAKFAIVILLTINGINIHNRIMPVLRAQTGRKLFDGLPNKTKIALCAAGAISGVSWLFPTLLGSAKELSYVATFVELMAVYVVATLAVTALALAVAAQLLPHLEAAPLPPRAALPIAASRSTRNVGRASAASPNGALRARIPAAQAPAQQRTVASRYTGDTSAFLADTLREVGTLASGGETNMEPTAYVPRRQARIHGLGKTGNETAPRPPTGRWATA